MADQRPRVTLGVMAKELNWSESTREAVDRILSDEPAKSLEGILLELLRDEDQLVRRDALEVFTKVDPSVKIQRQISFLAEHDSDPLSQAKARLILAEQTSLVPDRSSDSIAVPEIERTRKIGTNAARRRPIWEDEADGFDRQGVKTANFESTDSNAEKFATSSPRSDRVFKPLTTEFVNFSQNEIPPSPRAPREAFPEIEDPTSIEPGLSHYGHTEPGVLDRPFSAPDDVFSEMGLASTWPEYPLEAPLGYTGKSGILPIEDQESGHFVPVPDRWRSGYPRWDRYGRGHPLGEDYPYKEGHWWDPYNLNVLKGDYPISGQHTFMKITGQLDTIQEFRQVPTGTTGFESTVNPGQQQFFGNPNQYFTTNNLKLSVDLFHGNTGFKPIDWNVRLTPILNLNYLDAQELGIVNPNVTRGTTRLDNYFALQEYFVEAKLKDTSPDYDFTSLRVGSQQFTSDFRGFIFSDTNRAIRLFGTRLANRDQFNLAVFRQAEKDTNSQLNTFENRDQTVLIANYYRQDFIFPGYTAELNMHYNNDGPSLKYDQNGFLARPDPVGVFQPHRVETVYFGMAGDGHFGRINVNNAFYWATGRDSLNPMAGTSQTINAQMAAAEISYDRDWIRFRGSIFYASGDRNPYDHRATGFDTIIDNPNFAGGQFSYWQRQQIDLFGVGLVNRMSLVPDLRSSKFEGQANFVNPGLQLFNLGMDFILTPKAKLITNANYLQFDSVKVLEAYTFQNHLSRTIGVDLSAGLEYRPLLNDNIILTGGYACLVPGNGFKDLFGSTTPFTTANSGSLSLGILSAAFLQLSLTF